MNYAVAWGGRQEWAEGGKDGWSEDSGRARWWEGVKEGRREGWTEEG